jgi:hypothetical protein
MLLILVVGLLLAGLYFASRRTRRGWAGRLVPKGAPVIARQSTAKRTGSMAECLPFKVADFDVMRRWQDEPFAESRGIGLAIDWESDAGPEVLNVSVSSFDPEQGWTRVPLCNITRERDAIVVSDAGGSEHGRFDNIMAALDYLAETLTTCGEERPKLPPQRAFQKGATKES